MSKRTTSQPTAKKPRTTFGADPDVVVVVGGKDFHEHSVILRSWSEYFDAAIRSGMKESKSMRFEFPHRKPEEWEVLTSLFVPMATQKVTKENFEMVLSWCGELLAPLGIEECDKVIAAEVIPGKLFYHVDDTEDMLDLLSLSMDHSMHLSKEKCVEAVVKALNWETFWLLPFEFHGTALVCEKIASVMGKDEDVCKELLDNLEEHLPCPLPTVAAERNAFVRSAAFPMLIHSSMELKGTKKSLEKALNKKKKKTPKRTVGRRHGSLSSDEEFDPIL